MGAELGQDTGGTSQRRSAHGDPWREVATISTVNTVRHECPPPRVVVDDTAQLIMFGLGTLGGMLVGYLLFAPH